MTHHTRQIVIIDDDVDDILILEESLHATGLNFHLTKIHKGSEALAYFQQCSINPAGAKPDLIVLDLHLPEVDGLELLQAVRRNPVLKRLPIIAYTGVENDQQIEAAYSGGINCVIRKPSNLEEATNLAKSINEFWFSTLRLPT